MKTLRKTIFCSVLFLIAAMPPAFAQGTYTQIDDPEGVSGSFATGINNAGAITGWFATANQVWHGFLLVNGVYTTIDYPNSQQTVLLGINDVGQAVGRCDDLALGFMYDLATQSFTPIVYPGGAVRTAATSINNKGVIGGYFYQDDNSLPEGFELNGSTYREISVPLFGHYGEGTYVWGITTNGVVVGNDSLATSFFRYKHRHGPIKIPNYPNATVYGVSEDGTAVAGYTYKGVGFVYQNGVVQTLQFPNYTYASASGVNDSEETVGYFYNGGVGIFHAFLWTPF